MSLRIMGEMALRLGYPDLAVRCLALSLTKRQIWIPVAEILDDQQMPPYNEAYSAIWHYGILHEVGHAVTVSGRTIVADEFLAVAVQDALPHHLFPDSPPVTEIWNAILRERSHTLNPAQLRPEIVADMFAASVLLEATIMIMERSGEQFDPLAYITECLTSAAVIEIIERCRRRVSVLGDLRRSEPPGFEAEPVALGIRGLYMRRQLADDVFKLIGSDGLPMPVLEGAIAEISDNLLAPILQDIQPALRRAMSIAGETTPTTERLFENLRDQVINGGGSSFFQCLELAKLRKITLDCHRRSPLLDAFTDLVAVATDFASGGDPGPVEGEFFSRRRRAELLTSSAGIAWSEFNIGVMLEERDPPELTEARTHYTWAAEAGNTEAQNRLGLLLAAMVDPPELAEARAWLTRAAEAGHAEAQNYLGLLLSEWLDPPELAEASTWYTRAAEAGDAEAQYSLGVLLATRLDPPELAEARAWLTRAAKAGHDGAQDALEQIGDR